MANLLERSSRPEFSRLDGRVGTRVTVTHEGWGLIDIQGLAGCLLIPPEGAAQLTVLWVFDDGEFLASAQRVSETSLGCAGYVRLR